MKNPAVSSDSIQQAFDLARKRFADFGVDADAAVAKALDVPVSLHCWQTDDVGGLENPAGALATGGLVATGNYRGRARTGEEIRADIAKAASLIPGKLRVNIHAFYREPGPNSGDRDTVEIGQFSAWIDWAKKSGLPLDFNPTFFAHPKAADGLTLSHADPAIRAFWIRHGIASRKVAQGIAEALGSACVNNLWIPDGMKDSPADRWAPRERLVESLDQIFDANHGIDGAKCLDAVESKLFGIGCEDYTVGSMEFYSAYSLTRGLMLCLDMGHFHPTETIADKISALLPFHRRLLMHVSRPIRWDSDHVVLFNDDIRQVFVEVQRGAAWDKVFLALDYFDASINRLGAHVIGTRATRMGILNALLDPTQELAALEAAGKGAQKLGLMEAWKGMPFGAVWDELCRRANVPPGTAWMADMEAYEREVQSRRG